MASEKLDFSKIPKFYVYVFLSLRDGRFYVGFTANLQKRIRQHARGEVMATRYRRPLLLVHYEYFIDKADAKAREVFLKSGFGRGELRKSLKRTLSRYLP